MARKAMGVDAMTNYVAGFLFTRRLSGVALIRKARPAWQAGKLNAIGGHIETGEPPEIAMSREFMEEAGLFLGTNNWHQFAILRGENGDGWAVNWFWAVNASDREIQSMTDEQVAWYPVADIIAGKEIMIPNLRWLLPLALNDVHGLDSCALFDIREAQRR